MGEFRVALTFDAEHPDRPQCPPGAPERILDVLAHAGLRGTFFLQGRWVSAYPETVRRVVAADHLVGNHSDHHAHVTEFSDDGLRADVCAAESTIREVAGADPRPWFRCPFGDGRDDPRILGVLDALGYRNVHWDVEAKDWADGQTVESVTRTVLDGVRAHGDGAIVLLHTWPGPTPDALGSIVERLRADGASFVTVEEVLGGP